MGFFDIVTAPFKGVGKALGAIARSPVGDIAKFAAPIVMGPVGIPVSAGIGLAGTIDDDKPGFWGDALRNTLGGAATGAAGYGVSKIPFGSVLRSVTGGGAAPTAAAGGAVDLGQGAVIPAAVNAAAPAMAGGAAGAGAIPEALKWGSILSGGANLLGTGYDIYSGERAAGRARRLGEMVQPGFEERLAAGRERLGTRGDRAEDAERRRRERMERLTSGLGRAERLPITRGAYG